MESEKNCRYTEIRLPDYLAGGCGKREREAIARHLAVCGRCAALVREMETPLDMENGTPAEIAAPMARVFRGARKKFIARVAAITLAVLGALVVLWFAALFLGGIAGYSRIPLSQRALHNLVQFSRPDRVTGYGNTASLWLYMPIRCYTVQTTGLKAHSQKETAVQAFKLSGGFTSPAGFGAAFIHPDIIGEAPDSPTAAWVILEKSGENTVATVNLSLRRLISLEEAAALLDEYDMEILWMAVEAGVETVTPKNMSGHAQWLQWGLPGTFSLFQGGETKLTPATIEEYRAAVLLELEWLDAHRHLVKPDRSLLRHGLDNSVGGKAAYILENGIRIYGLQLTGPSAELLRLGRELPVRRADIVDVDFWYWR